MAADGCIIRAQSRIDEISNDNSRELSPLAPGVLSAEEDTFMPFLAGGCPVQVIAVIEKAEESSVPTLKNVG